MPLSGQFQTDPISISLSLKLTTTMFDQAKNLINVSLTNYVFIPHIWNITLPPQIKYSYTSILNMIDYWK